ncbi:hypothetical protein D0869_14357 [Hortaea werneckii]|uniref:Uncharacterized protein n=1 Tax=Hortaea werneckii TaxID=91943 RepID=A0A3M6W2A1_HORWE|nr:hypothetical protein KC324_g6415 [Hortaea werneckii]KAI7582929.1 hypothetical protein KC316_g7582 [Hortaea werneckii]RMX72688.1 hypothetical protein D0869_14357 [Hortaea werneckii]RMX90769.1 hypothetical protein D0868_14380 [Hortaea werneckii]
MNIPTRRHVSDPSRKRSRSPREHDRDRNVNRQRSRSPHRRHHHHHHHHHRHRPKQPSTHTALPFHTHPLHKRDLATHCALFAEYLDLQKRLDLDALGEDEAHGRWKSFVGKWNRGELAEGWYDPGTKRKVDMRYTGEGSAGDGDVRPGSGGARGVEPGPIPAGERAVQDEGKDGGDGAGQDDDEEDEEDEDEYGPSLPTSEPKPLGPAVPSLQDLQHRQELLEDDREARRAQIRADRRLDRKTQKERLEELVPRAEPGTRERQLEKKRERASANQAFREAKDGGAGEMEEVGDKELMGGGDGEDDYKAQVKARERQKNQREIRKEEVLRARAAEREGRVAEHRRKEERTMGMLRELAKQRYGS